MTNFSSISSPLCFFMSSDLFNFQWIFLELRRFRKLHKVMCSVFEKTIGVIVLKKNI